MNQNALNEQLNTSYLFFYMFLSPKKKKKKLWKVLPLYNVFGRSFVEEFWPPVSSHVSVSPFLCLQQPLKATTF